MLTVKLTKKLIELYPTPEKPVELYDSERRGFICKITPAGNRVFLVAYRSADGTKRKPRIGTFGQITLDQARETAGNLLAKVSLGENPSRDRRSSRLGVLVGNPIRLASGANRVMLVPDGRRSHIGVDRTDQLISLKGTA